MLHTKPGKNYLPGFFISLIMHKTFCVSPFVIIMHETKSYRLLVAVSSKDKKGTPFRERLGRKNHLLFSPTTQLFGAKWLKYLSRKPYLISFNFCSTSEITFFWSAICPRLMRWSCFRLSIFLLSSRMLLFQSSILRFSFSLSF